MRDMRRWRGAVARGARGGWAGKPRPVPRTHAPPLLSAFLTPPPCPRRLPPPSAVNLVVIGHVDSGKSTTTGHLIYKCGGVE